MTIKVPSKTTELLGEYAETEHDGNRSEAARELLAKGLRFDERVAEIEGERDRLRRELRAANARQNDVGELVEYVSDEQRYRQAGVFTRLKWWLQGMD
jgi:hypothetical protein